MGVANKLSLTYVYSLTLMLEHFYIYPCIIMLCKAQPEQNTSMLSASDNSCKKVYLIGSAETVWLNVSSQISYITSLYMHYVGDR